MLYKYNDISHNMISHSISIKLYIWLILYWLIWASANIFYYLKKYAYVFLVDRTYMGDVTCCKSKEALYKKALNFLIYKLQVALSLSILTILIGGWIC